MAAQTISQLQIHTGQCNLRLVQEIIYPAHPALAHGDVRLTQQPIHQCGVVTLTQPHTGHLPAALLIAANFKFGCLQLNVIQGQAEQ